jgi:hypothetical protein
MPVITIPPPEELTIPRTQQSAPALNKPVVPVAEPSSELRVEAVAPPEQLPPVSQASGSGSLAAVVAADAPTPQPELETLASTPASPSLPVENQAQLSDQSPAQEPDLTSPPAGVNSFQAVTVAHQLEATSTTELESTHRVILRELANVPDPDNLDIPAGASALMPAEVSLETAQIFIEPPPESEVRQLQQELRDLEETETFGNIYEGSPAITLAIPSGYGADDFRGFANFSFQSRTRFSNDADATMGVGIGLGDADEVVGFQLSYTLASFGTNREFGTGGFNAKLHRRLPGGWSFAVGWEGFITTGDDDVDFEDSVYGSITHIVRTTRDIADPFSRIALTAGIGNGRFRTEDAIFDDDDTVGVFGSIAARIARPVSAIVEWTGQDLAAGISVAPIRDFPWVITPAVRDLTGAGDGARFVLGTGISWQF